MTKEIKLIKDEIVRLLLLQSQGIETKLEDVLIFIDSLQEEPKFKLGQSIRQGDVVAKIVEVSEDGYHCDNAFVPFSAQDSWELVIKPLVDIEIPFGAKDSELLEESISIPEGCYAVIEGNRVVIRKGEEPVSKDLEEVAELWVLDERCKPWSELCKKAFKAGAQWQKERDKATLQDVK